MPFKSLARNLARLPFTALLRPRFIRRRIAFQMAHQYYDELDIMVPVGEGLSCPVSLSEHWCSFSEIFVEREYAASLCNIPLPDRWLDLGCYAGYFSLFTAWVRAQKKLPADFRALLVDGDPRTAKAVGKLISSNNLGGMLKFKQGVIAAGTGSKDFAVKSVMSSSVSQPFDDNSHVVSVPIVTESEIMELLPPPYDLIKIDIEGGEFEFLNCYVSLIKAAKYILLEWHSWHNGGGGAAQIRQLAEQRGLKLICEPVPPHSVTVNGRPEQCGLSLFRRVEE